MVPRRSSVRLESLSLLVVSPPMRTSPPSGRSSRPATCSSVDLPDPDGPTSATIRSEEHTSELQSLMRISYAVFCLKKKKKYIHRHEYYSIVDMKSILRTQDNSIQYR